MAKRSALTTLPRLTSQTRWVIDESLIEGHVQKSQCGSMTIFFENNKYHVTGLETDVFVGGRRVRVEAIYSFDYLPCARKFFSEYAKKYSYRTRDLTVTLKAEAILAKDANN